jgi:hypothetical protein
MTVLTMNEDQPRVTLEDLAEALRVGTDLFWIEPATKRYLRLIDAYAEQNDLRHDVVAKLAAVAYTKSLNDD